MASSSCPRCVGDLETKSINDVEVDVCGACAGVYLDRGELNQLGTHTEGDIEFCTVRDGLLETEDGQGVAHCPKCEGRPAMGKVECLSETAVVLDYCEGCGGLWLDEGELEQINQHLLKPHQTSTSWMIGFQLLVAQLLL